MANDSRHAKRRQQQRGIGDEAVEAVIRWGQCFHQPGGRWAFFLGERDALRALRAGEDVRVHVRKAVVLGPDGGMVTVIRIERPNRLKRWQDARVR